MARRGRYLKQWNKPTHKEMMTPILYELWDRAATETYGIGIFSPKPLRLQQLLYEARRECVHQDWNDLCIVVTETEVRIVRR